MFAVFTTFVATLSLFVGTLDAARYIHNSLLTNVLRSPMEFFDQTPIGRIINRFSKDVQAVDSDLPATLRAFANCFFGVLIHFIRVKGKNLVYEILFNYSKSSVKVNLEYWWAHLWVMRLWSLVNPTSQILCVVWDWINVGEWWNIEYRWMNRWWIWK